MIKIVGREIWRAGKQVGYFEEHIIRAHDTKKLGYFDNKYIYSPEGHHLAYIEGDYLVSYGGDSKIPLEKVSEAVEGGVMPEIEKCAVYVLLGS